MKREAILEMARKSGCGHESMTLDWIAPEGLTSFAKLVEQATLERAANKADSVGHHWSGAPARAFFELADEIRALKDSHE